MGTVDLLEEGSPAACTAADAQGILRNALLPDPQSPVVGIASAEAINREADAFNLALRQIEFDLENTSAAQVRQRERAVVCNASVVIRASMEGQNSENMWPIQYEVRRDLDSPEEIVVVGDFVEVKRQIAMLVQNLMPSTS